MALSTIISLDTVLSAIGESKEDFVTHVFARRSGIPELDRISVGKGGELAYVSFNEYIDRLLVRVNNSDNISADNKKAARAEIHNYLTYLVGDGTAHLPEQGELILKRIGQDTQATLDSIVSSSDDVAQIGFYKIPESYHHVDSPRVIPSSINIQEHLLNQPVPTVRSKSVGVIPNHSSKHTVTIDIVFPNFEIFSSSQVEYPSFINLYNMFKFMPINSIYSSALCAAFVSAYTYPKLVSIIGQSHAADEFKKQTGTPEDRLRGFIKELDIGDLDTLKGLLGESSSQLDIGWNAAVEHVTGGQTLEDLGYDWDVSEYDSGGQDNGIAKFPVPVCFKGASLQTMQDMPGAILGRFSFGIVSSPAFPHGTIAYRNKEGDPTIDPDDCYWAKKYISIASNKVLDQLEIDKSAVMRISGGAEGLTEVTNNDIRLYYFDIVHGPILFDTTSDRYNRTETQSPIVLEKVSGSFNAKTIDIPLMGSKFPSCQYMGLNSSAFQMIFAITDKKIISDFMAMKAKIVDSERSQHILKSFGIIENPLINSLGVTRVTPQSVTIESDPDSPDLYRLIVNFIENYQDMSNEKLQLEKGAVAISPLEDIWEYMYQLYRIWASGQPAKFNKSFPFKYSMQLDNDRNSTYRSKLNDLMRVIGLNMDDPLVPTILNPGRGGTEDPHSVYYGPVFMGIIDQVLQLSNSGLSKPTGYMVNDFNQLLHYPLSRTSTSGNDSIQNALIQIAHGAIRADRQFEPTGAGFFRSTVAAAPNIIPGLGTLVSQEIFANFGSVFETQNEHKAQQIFHSPELYQLFYGGDARLDPFVRVYNEEGGDYNQDNWFDYGVDPTENKYYQIAEDYTDVHVNRERLDMDDSVYGIRPKGYDESDFEAKNIVDIFHKQGKILPKPLWDSILKCIIGRIHTKDKDTFVSAASMSKSYSILSSLVLKFPGLFQFDMVTRDNPKRTISRLARSGIYGARRPTQSLGNSHLIRTGGYQPHDNSLLSSQMSAIVAEWDISKYQETNEKVNAFNNTIINLYPDLYLPTYSELFNDTENPLDDDGQRFNFLLKKFAPKCGDRGVLPNKNSDGTYVSTHDLMQMTISDISDSTAAGPDEYIDPDIFYYRRRDKQNMAEFTDQHPPDFDTVNSKMIQLAITDTMLLDKLLDEAGHSDDYYTTLREDKILAELNRFFYEKIAGPLQNKRMDAVNSAAIVESISTEIAKNLGVPIDTLSASRIEKVMHAMKAGAPSIEFTTTNGSLIGILSKSPDSSAYESVGIGKYTTPTYSSNGLDISLAMDDEAAITSIDKQQIAHMPDLTESILRSFPTIRLYFIEEDRDEAYYQDDFYGFSDILECSISSHIYDNDICTMKLSNASGVLSSMSFSNYTHAKKIKNSPGENNEDGGIDMETASSTNVQESIRLVDDEGERFLKKIMLRPGIHIMVKMGYGNNIEHLRTVFTGEISEVKSGSIVEIIAQGFQTELQNNFGGFFDENWMETLRHWVPDLWTDEWDKKYSFLDIINYIILGDISRSKKLLGKGMSHLGEDLQVAPYRKGHQWAERNKKWGYREGSNEITAILGTETVAEFRSKGDNFSFFDNFMEYQYYGFKGYDLTRNIYTTSSNASEVSITNEWLVTNGTVIDGLREVTRYMPNFIATVVPYRQDATLFVGDPAGVYEHRPPTEEEKKYLIKYNMGSKYKNQDRELQRHNKYMILFDQIKRLSIDMGITIDSYNRIKIMELLRSGKLSTRPKITSVIYRGSRIEIPSHIDTQYKSKIKYYNDLEAIGHGDEDLERLVYSIYFNPVVLGNRTIEARPGVHANLLGIFLNLSKEEIRDNFASLAKLSRQIGKFYVNSHSYPISKDSDSWTPYDSYTVNGSSNSNLTFRRLGSQGRSTSRVHLLLNGRKFWIKDLAPDLIMSNPSDLAKFKMATKKHTNDENILNYEFLKGVSSNRPNYVVEFEPFMRATLRSNLVPLGNSPPRNTSKKVKSIFHPYYKTASDNNFDDIVKDTIIPYKQVLLLASEILDNEDPSEVESVVRELMTGDDDDRSTLPYSYKIFRDHHVVSTTHDLIANNIAASETDMWSAVRLLVPIDTVDETAGHGNWGPMNYGIEEGGIERDIGMFQIDSDQAFGSWPHKDVPGMNYRGMYPTPKDILETFTEINATTPNLAQRVMAFRIAQGASKMYRGNLIMMGRNIKPYDAIHLADDVNDMYGTVMAERVIQNFSAVNGWTTTVVPCGLTRVNSALGVYDRGMWEKLFYTIGEGRAFGHTFNTIMLATLLIPVLGGGILAGGVVASVFLRTLFGSARAALSLIPKYGTRLAGGNTWKIISETAVAIGRGAKAGDTLTKSQRLLPGVWQAATSGARSSTQVGRGAWSVQRGAGVTNGQIIGHNFAAGAGLIVPEVVVGKLGVIGGATIVDQFMNPTFSQSSVLTKGDDDSFSRGKVYLPCKMGLLRYNGAPFAAGLDNLYTAIENNGGWNDVMHDLGYMLREWFASPGSNVDDPTSYLTEIGEVYSRE